MAFSINKTALSLLLIIVPLFKVYTKTIEITDHDQKLNLNGYLDFYEDKTKALSIRDIQHIDFSNLDQKPEEINLGHSKSAYWLKFTLTNNTKHYLSYILGIQNATLDEVDIYIFENNKLIKKTQTGESRSVENRDLPHRHLIVDLKLQPESNYDCYVKIMNNGGELTIPVVLKTATDYFLYDEKQIFSTGLFNGLFFMIFTFTLYLFWRIKEKVYLFYSFYVLLSTMYVLGEDGLTAFIMPAQLALRSKLMFLHMSMFSLIMFTQEFYKTSNNRKDYKFNTYFKILKICAVSGAIITYFPYPYRLMSIYLGTAIAPIIFITIIFVSIVLYNKQAFAFFYTLAFLFMLSSAIIYILNDYGIMVNSELTYNSLKIGKAIEGVFLTIAVVERFKYKELQDKLLIKDRSEKIETQKITLQEINDQLEKLSIVASETDNAIAIYNAHQEIEWCNIAFERLYGKPLATLIADHGKNLRQLSNYKDIELAIEHCIENKKSIRYESKKEIPDRDIIWTQTTLTPYFEKDGNLSKLISIDTNISRLKEIQNELIYSRDKAEESDKLKSAFLSNISHEIRTPLNAILGFSELLLSSNSDEGKRIKYLNLIRNNGRNLLKLISDIIDISRIESGEIKLEIFKGNINLLIKEILDQYKIELESNLSKNIEIKCHLDLEDEKCEVFIDHYKIRQVFTNLLNNAVKFTMNGSIEIGYFIENKIFKFYVKDTGIGIEEEQQKVIFQRFRQVELGLSRRYEGTGLGLTLSKGLIEKMGGKLWVESKIGEGSTFYFTAPYEPITNIATPEPQENFSVDLKGKNILLVEDTKASRELIIEILADTNAIIDEAHNGQMALELFEKNKYDAILMDIRLPDINGYEVTREIRKIDKEIYILAQTANAMDNDRKKSFEAGCDEYLTKPFEANTLLSKLKKRLEKN